jgi:molybdopterin/thiamine biosynthesis adenylyltransferase
MLSDNEKIRYHRQLIIDGFTEKHQEKLKKSRVLIVGLGGLGSPAAIYLAAIGVGTIGIVDKNTVTISNLQRQILYNEKDIGKDKTKLAENKLQNINSQCKIEVYNEWLTEKNASRIINMYDLVLDGTDNFYTRYIIDDICKDTGKPYVYAAIDEFQGQLCVFHYRGKTSYRDLFAPNTEEILGEDKTTNAVIGATSGVIGTLQANEAIKIITGLGHVLSDKLLIYNGLNMSFVTINLF